MTKKLTIVFLMAVFTVLVWGQEAPGRIDAYYAKKDMSNHHGNVKKGELIIDVYKGGVNHMKDMGSTYQYINDNFEDEGFTVAKADVEHKTFMMSPLNIADVGQGMYFTAKNGMKARIFKANMNGHKYRGCSNINLVHNYVLSVEMNSEYGKTVYESQINVKNGKLLHDGYFMYFSHPVKEIDGSAYDKSGRLLVDLTCDFDGIDCTAAYIPSEKALYFDGTLYYLNEGNSIPTETKAEQQPEANSCPPDLPLNEIFKLIDNEIEAGPLLKAAGYKYVGDYSEEASRVYIQTWCRNCTCNKRGDVLSFQSGTSSIVCFFYAMGCPTTLNIEVFNTKARDAIVAKLTETGFTKDSSNPNPGDWFSKTDGEYEVSAVMQKTKKGWSFNIMPVMANSDM